MAIVVEHDKRKREILEKAMELFCREGYEDVTFQKIADACGVTRTTLYIYFKNKNEVFNFCIKQATTDLEIKFMEIIEDKSLGAKDCLSKLVCDSIDVCFQNRSLFEVLIPYLAGLHKTGINVDEKVRRRTIRINHLFSLILIRGIKNGEFKDCSVKDANEMLFSLLEASVFNMAILHNIDVETIKASARLAVEGLVRK